jgi:esterase/lipase
MRPDIYAGLRVGTMRGFMGFLEACSRVRLIGIRKDAYHFSRRLLDALDLQDIRVENPIAVHANEAFPIKAVREVAENVLKRLDKMTDKDIADLRFDDMLREHAALRLKFGKKDPHMLLAADNPLHGSPYLLKPEPVETKTKGGHARVRQHGVLLVHGFATTPADLRGYAEHLRDRGYTVLGLRLPGHGTSILDLEARHRSEWLAALHEGYGILAELCDEVSAIGFSTGGALALQLAAGKPEKLIRVASVAAPLEVQNKKMKYVPVGMILRAILEIIPGLTDVLRFHTYDRDITGTVYHRVPVSALNQLRLTIADMWGCLPRVSVPVLVLQGLLDRTVVPESAVRIFRRLGCEVKALRWIAGGPHGLITQKFGNTWDILDGFLAGEDVTGTAKAASYKNEHAIVAPPLNYAPQPKRRITRKLAQWLITRKAPTP